MIRKAFGLDADGCGVSIVLQHWREDADGPVLSTRTLSENELDNDINGLIVQLEALRSAGKKEIRRLNIPTPITDE